VPAQVADALLRERRGKVFKHLNTRDEVVLTLDLFGDRPHSAKSLQGRRHLLYRPRGDVDATSVDTPLAERLDEHPERASHVE